MFFLLKGSWNGTLLPYAWPSRFEYGLTSLPNRPGSKTYIGALILSGSWGGPCSWHTYAYIKYSTHVYNNWHKLNQRRHIPVVYLRALYRGWVWVNFQHPHPLVNLQSLRSFRWLFIICSRSATMMNLQHRSCHWNDVTARYRLQYRSWRGIVVTVVTVVTPSKYRATDPELHRASLL